MNSPDSSIPWNTPALWLEANASLEHLLHRRRQALEESRRLAHLMLAQLASIFPLMDRLCRIACPTCTDICCQHACVWIDFKDLLFFHLAAIPVPGSQLLSERGQHCRYGTPDGCRLDRLQRPFVCTWYLCPAQAQCLREQPAQWHNTMACLQHIKHLRQHMEIAFIRAIHPATSALKDHMS